MTLDIKIKKKYFFKLSSKIPVQIKVGMQPSFQMRIRHIFTLILSLMCFFIVLSTDIYRFYPSNFHPLLGYTICVVYDNIKYTTF